MPHRSRSPALVLSLALVLTAACLSEVKEARPELRGLRIAVASEVPIDGEDSGGALREGLDRDLRSSTEAALSRAGFDVVTDDRAPRDFTAQLSVQLDSDRAVAGTVGTAHLMLRDAAGLGVDAAAAKVNAHTWSTSAFADQAAAELASRLGQSDRLVEVAHRTVAH